MKIRHPALISAAGFGIAWAVRLWISTVRYSLVALDAQANPFLPGQTRRFIYSFWHETLLLPAWQYRKTPTDVLISDHADGEMIAQACQRLGMGVVRGSETRGGVKAIRQILEQQGKRNVVITPDGPRGPRRVIKPTMIHLAARTGLPIVPVGFAFRDCKRLRSWDRFALPKPFTDAVGVIGPRIIVPADLSRSEIELWRTKVQQGMDHATTLAEERVRMTDDSLPFPEVRARREQRRKAS